jgi:hypothetical protein
MQRLFTFLVVLLATVAVFLMVMPKQLEQRRPNARGFIPIRLWFSCGEYGYFCSRPGYQFFKNKLTADFLYATRPNLRLMRGIHS